MRDDVERAYAEAVSLLDAYPDLAAIYNIGAGSSGIARALKERGRERDVTFIAHEISAENRLLLLDGTLDAVIDQNPRVEAREALNILEQRRARPAAGPTRRVCTRSSKRTFPSPEPSLITSSRPSAFRYLTGFRPFAGENARPRAATLQLRPGDAGA